MDLGIYIHIPYCVRKCNYCDFKSYSGMEDTIPEYFDVLQKEIITYKNISNTVDTVFIGGGTPSIVNTKYLEKTLDVIYKNFNFAPDCEITIECNPGTVTLDKMKSYSSMGVNRISLGLQSADDSELKILGRIHNFKDHEISVEYALKAGFKNINTDLIIGIPGQTRESLVNTLEKVCAMPLTHISAYSLILEENTVFDDMYKSGKLTPVNDDDERQMYAFVLKYLTGKGYRQYEISNFAKEGYECKHNIKYWKAREYLSFGAAAHSFFNGKRYWNYDTIDEYIAKGREKVFGKDDKDGKSFEIIGKPESMKEFMMLGLRMTDGISIKEFKIRYGEDLKNIFQTQIRKLLSLGLIEENEDKIKLTRRGLDLANVAFMEFI